MLFFSSYVCLSQVEFVGYLLNPKFVRGGAAGDAARLAAPLRNQRVQLQVRADTGHAARLEMERAERSRKRIEQGGPTGAGGEDDKEDRFLGLEKGGKVRLH